MSNNSLKKITIPINRDFHQELLKILVKDFSSFCNQDKIILIMPTQNSCLQLKHQIKLKKLQLTEVFAINDFKYSTESTKFDLLKIYEFISTNLHENNSAIVDEGVEDFAAKLVNLIDYADYNNLKLTDLANIDLTFESASQLKLIDLVIAFEQKLRDQQLFSKARLNVNNLTKFIAHLPNYPIFLVGLNENLSLVKNLYQELNGIPNIYLVEQNFNEQDFSFLTNEVQKRYQLFSTAFFKESCFWNNFNLADGSINLFNLEDQIHEAQFISNIVSQNLGKRILILSESIDLLELIAHHLTNLKIDFFWNKQQKNDTHLAMTWLKLCLEFLIDPDLDLNFTALLKHPYGNFDYAEEFLIKKSALPKHQSEELDNKKSILSELAKDFIKFFESKEINFHDLFNAHLQFAIKATEVNFLNFEYNQNLQNLITKLSCYPNLFGLIKTGNYKRILNSLFNSLFNRIENKSSYHNAAIRLSSLIDAQLEFADIVVISGLNYDICPGQLGGEFPIAYKLLQKIGFESFNEYVKNFSHLIFKFMFAKQVFMTKSNKLDHNFSMASPWYQVIKLLLINNGINCDITPNKKIQINSKKLENEINFAQVPLDFRPKKLSVTQVEKLVNNQFQFYVDHILKLSKLDYSNNLGAREFGIILHKTIETYLKAKRKIPFLNIAKSVINNFNLSSHGKVISLWWPRIERIGSWFEQNQFANNHFQEVYGEIKVNDNLIISARADLIQIYDNDELLIQDFKTGQIPSLGEIKNGQALQLWLEAYIAAKGGFYFIKDHISSVKLEYLQLSGDETITKTIQFSFETKQDAILIENLFDTIRNFLSDPKAKFYLSDKVLNDYCPYSHLARKF